MLVAVELCNMLIANSSKSWVSSAVLMAHGVAAYLEHHDSLDAD